MIADTSAWIEYLRRTGSPIHLFMKDALARRQTVWLPDVVYQEVLQGARDAEHFLRLRHMLDQFEQPALPEPRDLAGAAALLYARCRWRGLRVRSPNDCLIAACCIASGQPLLALDRDFAAIASVDSRLERITP